MEGIKTIHEIIEEISPHYKKKGEPDAIHTLVYESYSETLEPVYFFIIDLMNDFGLDAEKLIDNFTDAPGSTHFSETGLKAIRMQEEASKMMQTISVLIRSILQIIYDLKEFKMRLQTYDDLKSSDKHIKEASRLSLKQIWLDKVDIAKGQTSLKAMALGQAGFQTLLEAFLVANNNDDVSKLDLNDRVKRILFPRLQEFNIWVEQSENELRKRNEIQKSYLKSQVSSIKLYSRWVKPYLKAAQQLQSSEAGRNPALTKVFNRVLLELTVLGKSKIKVEEAALAGNLPSDFQKMKVKRDYYKCVLVDFSFRALPQQGNFLGRADIVFRAYALNEDEINKLNEELDKSDLGDVLRLIEGSTTESLEQMQDEINFFLEDNEQTEQEKRKSGDVNPFSALLGRYENNEKKDKKVSKNKSEAKKEIIVKPDDWIEKTHLRKLAEEDAKELVYKLFDIYKKAHGMPSYT